MAEAGGIRAGRAFVELGGDDRKLRAALDRAKARVQAFGRAIAGIGARMTVISAALTAPLLAATKTFTSFGDQLDKMAARTGMSVEALSELKVAVELSGGTFEGFEQSIRMMQKNLSDAAVGTNKASQALAEFGLNARVIAQQSPEEQFMILAEAIGSIENPAKRASTAMAFFGEETGAKLLPLLAGGAKGIAELRRQAADLGLTVSRDAATAAAKLNDSWTLLTAVFKAAAFSIGEALAPSITEAINRVTRFAVLIRQWIAANKQIVVTVAKVAVGIGLAGAALIAAGGIVLAFGAAIGVAAKIVGVLSAGIGIIGTTMAAVLSPIGLVVTAVAGLGTAILYYSGAGAAALDWLRDRFRQLFTFARGVLGGIADALKGGDLALAAQIAWLGVQVAFYEGKAKVLAIWDEFRNSLVAAASTLGVKLVEVLSIAWAGIQIAWTETVAAIQSAWSIGMTAVMNTWSEVQGFLEKGFLYLMGLFDDSLDVGEAFRQTDAKTDQQKADRESAKNDQLSQIEQKRRDSVTDIQKDLAARQAVARAEQEAAAAGLNAQQSEQVARARAAAADAQAKLKAAIAKAGEVADKLADPVQGFDIRKYLDTMKEAMTDSAADMGRTAGPRGIFNVAAIQSLQSSESMAAQQLRTAKDNLRAAKETARNTQIMRERLQNSASGGAFT